MSNPQQFQGNPQGQYQPQQAQYQQVPQNQGHPPQGQGQRRQQPPQNQPQQVQYQQVPQNQGHPPQPRPQGQQGGPREGRPSPNPNPNVSPNRDGQYVQQGQGRSISQSGGDGVRRVVVQQVYNNNPNQSYSPNNSSPNNSSPNNSNSTIASSTVNFGALLNEPEYDVDSIDSAMEAAFQIDDPAFVLEPSGSPETTNDTAPERKVGREGDLKREAEVRRFSAHASRVIEDPNSVSSQVLNKLKTKDAQLIQLNQNLKAKDFELTAIQHDNSAQEKRIVLLMEQNKQLQERIQALEDESLINNKILNEVGILQFEKERLLFDLSAKDTQIASLREALSVGDAGDRNTRIKVKNEVIEQLNGIVKEKENSILELQRRLTEATKEGLVQDNKSLKNKIEQQAKQILVQVDTITLLEQTNKDLKEKYSQAFDEGKTISNTNEIELQFKVEELTSSARLIESKLAAKEIQLKDSQDKCKKLERALVDAKKVEFIEKKFLDMVKLLDAHKHENRGHYKETIEKLNKETEEKKILQSKLIVIKEEYKKLLASTKQGPSVPHLLEQINELKLELTKSNNKLNSVKEEYKVVLKEKLELEKELSKNEPSPY